MSHKCFNNITSCVGHGSSSNIKSKTIDLTKYYVNGSSLNDTVIMQYASGGGKTSVNNTDGTKAFWKDVSTDSRIQFLIDADSVKIISDAKSLTLMPSDETILAVETSFLISVGGTTARVTVMFGKVNDATEITVVVETISTTS